MGSGGGFLDYDGNGELDIYLIQAGPLPGSQSSERLLNQLFRQDPDGSFTDVTSESGLGDTGYGTGLAVGDIDNDGLLDLYVTNDGPDALYHNQGGGMFRNVTQQAGITGNFWSASAAFCDYDNDGFLDLYVTRYVRFDPSKQCTSSDGSPDYCSPQSYGYESDVLYRNEGTGSFTDVSRTAGLHGVEAPGLGVVCADFNLDGLMDFYVSNDGEANQLWENQGRGKFIDQAFFNGSAMNEFGQAEAGMGIGLGDADGDGDLDLFLTHLTGQTNTFYRNEGAMGFEDVSAAVGFGVTSLPWTGFGTAFFDYDHDGDLDIALVNGRVDKQPPVKRARMGEYWNSYAEPNFLFQNDGSGHFTDVSSLAGLFASQVEISRGLALGDVDDDGDLDLLVTNTAGTARLFRNDAPKQGNWLLVRAYDPARRRDSHGALITVIAGGRSMFVWPVPLSAT